MTPKFIIATCLSIGHTQHPAGRVELQTGRSTVMHVCYSGVAARAAAFVLNEQTYPSHEHRTTQVDLEVALDAPMLTHVTLDGKHYEVEIALRERKDQP